MGRGIRAALIVCAVMLGAAARASADAVDAQRLKQMRLEELMQVEVTSVAKKSQRRGQIPAAIYVITQEDIRRSGAKTLPEALRLAPGVHVARIDANKWAIGIRGFTSRLSRSILVLIDGRSVYTPLFAGVFWEVQDVFLEDVDRIEVIRGPGGTLWGANAVQGVINIITKTAADTHGQLVTGGGGAHGLGFGGARHGGRLGEHLHYRLYGKGFTEDGAFTRDTRDFDAWHRGQGGFRMDWTPPGPSSATLQGDYYDGDVGTRAAITRLTPPAVEIRDRDTDVSGGNLLGRWQYAFPGGSDLALQVYYDRTARRDVTFREDRDTGDLDLQHRLALGGVHDVVWGLGYRVSSGDVTAVPSIVFTPSRRTNHLFTGFLQDEVTLVPERVHAVAGTKLEYNDYSGFEVQPTARLLFTPDRRQTFWAAISRAVRTPSRVEQDLAIDALLDPSTPTFARVIGDGRFESERLVSYELGYRLAAHRMVSVDVAAFYGDYADLLSIEQRTPFTEVTASGDRTIVPSFLRNRVKGESTGIEVVIDVFPTPWSRLSATYSYLELELSRAPGSSDVTTEAIEGSSPHHRAGLRAFLDLPGKLELDTMLRYVDNLPAQGVGSYLELDLHLGWWASPNLELALVGQNLLQDHHPEFGRGIARAENERVLYGKVTWRR